MRRGIKTIALELKERASSGVPYELHFAPTGSLSKDEIAMLEKHLKEHFISFMNTWIIPLADELLKKV